MARLFGGDWQYEAVVRRPPPLTSSTQVAGQSGSAHTASSAHAIQVKVAKVAAVCSATASLLGRAAKVAPTTSTASSAPVVTARSAKAAVETAVLCSAPTVQATRSTVRAQGAVVSAALTGMGAAAKITTQRGQSTTTTVAQGTQRKITAKVGHVSAAASTNCRAVKTASGRAALGAAPLLRGIAVKRTPAGGFSDTMAAATSAPRKVAQGVGQANGVGFAYWAQGVLPRQVYGFCSGAGSVTSRATHIAVRTAQLSTGTAARSGPAKRATPGGTAAAGQTCQGRTTKWATASGSSSTAGHCQTAIAKRATESGQAYAVAGVVGQRRALLPYTPRPDEGTTSRPAGGHTTRPSTGTTLRPSGTTLRPDTGVTPRPVVFT